MKRKFISVVLAATMMLTACSSNESGRNQSSSDRDNYEIEEEETEDTELPTNTPTPAPIMAKLKEVAIGDVVYFGAYEQDNDMSNGKEDIEWLVIAKEGNKALLISKYALDCQKYNTEYGFVTWETCSLRSWLNNNFINSAFDAREQDQILTVTITNSNNAFWETEGGNDTNDKVFILSIGEANKYFSSNWERVCQGTAYCYAQGARKYDNGYCRWWLRSPGNLSDMATYVDRIGDINDYGDNILGYDFAVRPALWINLES